MNLPWSPGAAGQDAAPTVQGRRVRAVRAPPSTSFTGECGVDYDVVVIGSGFGGGVAALRLTEKGYSVGVVESGRRLTPATLPNRSWLPRSLVWAPKLGCTASGSSTTASSSPVPASVAADPSLSITAQAERAMSLSPNTDEPDQGPPLGSADRRLARIRPRYPVVPAGAPAALPTTGRPGPVPLGLLAPRA